ncbi:MAG TPA: type II toxin-antitoxin system PemK/MazF family toxin [Pirellulales bacterium]|nr:type II toxin-antitoxin system PemK/MazF family toxin [Pirellulales bacterium]
MTLAEIWLVNFPFTDRSSTKLRPVLLVSADKFNVDGDIVVLPISSQVFAGDPFSYVLDQALPAFRLTGLKAPSSVKWTKPVTLAGRIFQRRLGHLSGKPLDEIRELLRSVFT